MWYAICAVALALIALWVYMEVWLKRLMAGLHPDHLNRGEQKHNAEFCESRAKTFDEARKH